MTRERKRELVTCTYVRIGVRATSRVVTVSWPALPSSSGLVQLFQGVTYTVCPSWTFVNSNAAVQHIYRILPERVREFWRIRHNKNATAQSSRFKDEEKELVCCIDDDSCVVVFRCVDSASEVYLSRYNVQ